MEENELAADRPDVGHGEAKRILRAEPGDAASLSLPGRKGGGDATTQLMLLGPPLYLIDSRVPPAGSGIVEGHHWTQPCGSVDRGLVLTTHHPAHFSLGLGYLALQEMLLLFKPFSFKAPAVCSGLGQKPHQNTRSLRY